MNWKRFFLQKIVTVGSILFALTVLSMPSTVSSAVRLTTPPYCACCADPGEWSLETRKIEDHETGELNRLTPDGRAGFYATDAFPDDVSGVAAPNDDINELVVSIVREQRDWKLFFKTSGGRTGALILPLPGTATFFNADISEGPRPERTATVGLYKEIRLEGQLRGTGIFAKGIAPKTRFKLVLQGRGNRCLSAQDFYRWNLRISGPQAGYAIYGFFAKLGS